MEFHSIANIFPMMSDDEYRALVESIRKDGLEEPIWIYEGKIIDGRNRYRACLEAEVKPEFQYYGGDDPVGFVVRMNLMRRHLTSSQRAIAALDAEKMLAERNPPGRPKKGEEKLVNSLTNFDANDGKAAQQAAQLFSTNRQYVSDAKTIAEKAPELLDQVRAGEITIPQAKREIVKRERAETPELPTDKYRIIYADPPWKYGNDGVINDDNYGHVSRHYPSMSIQELCELPVRELADNDAVLFLWVTSPLLRECFDVIKAWGFEYKTSFVWDKIKHNFGHYNSVRHELLLVCTRGSCTPDNLQLFDSVQSIERTDTHSEKPEQFREIINTLYTHGKRIELFARKKVDNWEIWTNEPIAN